ncbi:peptidoglycan-binding protein [Leifsonia sp. SIMBA_070]|uniref:peptidoglycan-binding protein n=1 Tax=Leifsonia sp. SIMBA_070 TaxID=3085810 RepID=UPI00397D1EFC
MAASKKAPAPGAVTAVVSRGDLLRTVSTKVSIVQENRYAIPLVAGAPREVVTGMGLSVGESLGEGALIAEVNGRPRFAFSGSFPFYRDMRFGDTGPDVRQLQEGLSRAGLSVGVDGRFGAGTEAAVSHLYAVAGYEPNREDATGSPTPRADEPDPGDKTASGPEANQAPALTVPQTRLTVPAADLLVFASLPAVATSIPRVGAVLTESSEVTVASGRVVAETTVDAASAGQLKEGMSATVDGLAPEKVNATVASISPPSVTPQGTDAIPTDGSRPEDRSPTSGGGEQWTVRLIFASDPSTTWLGKDALAVVTILASATDSLLVPTSAVITTGHGKPYVLKSGTGGSFARVEVVETGSLSGRSAISPVVGGELKPGDAVKVG